MPMDRVLRLLHPVDSHLIRLRKSKSLVDRPAELRRVQVGARDVLPTATKRVSQQQANELEKPCFRGRCTTLRKRSRAGALVRLAVDRRAIWLLCGDDLLRAAGEPDHVQAGAGPIRGIN